MAIQDDQSPATKQDITMLMVEYGKLLDANERWKDEFIEKTERWKEEIMNHFDLVAENLRHDIIGAHKECLHP